MNDPADLCLEHLCESDHRFPPAAYRFVCQSVFFAQKKGNSGSSHERTHISADELIQGLTELADDEFGPMAAELLSEWRLNTSGDVGTVIEQLVRAGILERSSSDDLAGFCRREHALASGKKALRAASPRLPAADVPCFDG